MAKWKEPDGSGFEGQIRAVNYNVGHDEDGRPLFKHRLEQFGPWGWQPVPVYHEHSDGSLVEIKQ